MKRHLKLKNMCSKQDNFLETNLTSQKTDRVSPTTDRVNFTTDRISFATDHISKEKID